MGSMAYPMEREDVATVELPMAYLLRLGHAKFDCAFFQ